MKHVGLNVAADPLFTASYTGVNGGMVLAVADDPGMHSSQNEQDSRHYAVSAKIPMLEPADSAEARDFAKRAFELSEEYDTPVFLKLCTRISHSQSIVELGQRVEPARRPYEKDIAKYVMVPGNARPRHPIVEERTRRLTAFAETTDLNREEMGEDTSIGIITSSTSYQYVREVFGDKACVLKLGLSWPMPVQKIQDFAAQVDKVLVVEELEPIIENHCRQIGVEVSGKAVKDLNQFDLSNLRWSKVVICTDGDVDGFQIRTLILTMLYRLCPTLIREGYVYIAETPLFEITCKEKSGEKTWFAYSEKEKADILKKLEGKKINVQRSKGLGENDPEMMWMTTMSPETRRLIRVLPEDAEETARVFDLLLGDNLSGRKDYIAENGYKYLDMIDVS